MTAPSPLVALLDQLDAEGDEQISVLDRAAAVPHLTAAVRAVLELHAPLDRGTGPQCQGCATHITFTGWPCPTVTALSVTP